MLTESSNLPSARLGSTTRHAQRLSCLGRKARLIGKQQPGREIRVVDDVFYLHYKRRKLTYFVIHIIPYPTIMNFDRLLRKSHFLILPYVLP